MVAITEHPHCVVCRTCVSVTTMNGSPALPVASLSLSFGKIKHCLFEFFHRPLKFKFSISPIHNSVLGYYQICLYLVIKGKMAIRVFFSMKQNIGSLKCCIPRFCTAMYSAIGDQRSKLFKLMIAAVGPKIFIHFVFRFGLFWDRL